MAEKKYNTHLVIKNEDIEKYLSQEMQEDLEDIINTLKYNKEMAGEDTDKGYYIVNIDEPYADDILQLILKGEDLKQS